MLTCGFVKRKALKALQNKWTTCVLVMLLITAAGLVASIVVSVLQAPYLEQADYWLKLATEAEVVEQASVYLSKAIDQYMTGTTFGFIQIAATVIGWLFMLPAVSFFLDLADGRATGNFKEFSSRLDRAGESFVLYLQISVRVFLWSLLLIIPGIVKALAYALAPMIKARNPERTASECIAESQRLMEGKKASLFVLYLSFIGWFLLVMLASFGAGIIPVAGVYIGVIATFVAQLFLNAYIMMSEVAFYGEVVHATPADYDVYGTPVPPPPPPPDVFNERDPFS